MVVRIGRFKPKPVYMRKWLEITISLFPSTGPNYLLVGGFNPFENISQNGSFPQVGMKIKNI